jgi:hypothetical protein
MPSKHAAMIRLSLRGALYSRQLAAARCGLCLKAPPAGYTFELEYDRGDVARAESRRPAHVAACHASLAARALALVDADAGGRGARATSIPQWSRRGARPLGSRVPPGREGDRPARRHPAEN